MTTPKRPGIELANAYGAGTPAAGGAAPAAAPPSARPARGSARPPRTARSKAPKAAARTRAAKPSRSKAPKAAARTRAAKPPRSAPDADPLLGERQMVNTRVPAALWQALHERAARAGVTHRIAVIDALLSAVELPESDHTARLRGTVIRETEARAAAHDVADTEQP